MSGGEIIAFGMVALAVAYLVARRFKSRKRGCCENTRCRVGSQPSSKPEPKP